MIYFHTFAFLPAPFETLFICRSDRLHFLPNITPVSTTDYELKILFNHQQSLLSP